MNTGETITRPGRATHVYVKAAVNPDTGEPYRDRDGRTHAALSRQPVIVLSAPANVLRNCRSRANERGVPSAVYIEEMFATGHDEANRAVFAEHGADEDNTVGFAVRAERKVVDKITRGAKMAA